MSAAPKAHELGEDRLRDLAAVLEPFGLEPEAVTFTRLNRAFVHRSYRTEAGLEEDNERLEFLGDSVIGLACTEFLLEADRKSDEGILSKLRAALVSRTVLGRIATEMDLGRCLLLGTGEERSGGRSRSSILGSTLEAVCGALYLDFPWPQLNRAIQRAVILPALEIAERENIVDYKSRLQEWAQKEFQMVPLYRVIAEGGPDHGKLFEVEVTVDGRVLGRGRGRRKKLGENEAARVALEAMVPPAEE